MYFYKRGINIFSSFYRTLKSFGFLFICEPIEKWNGKIDNLENTLKEIGFNIYGEIKKTKKFIYITAVK